jgi:hypothetical protein
MPRSPKRSRSIAAVAMLALAAVPASAQVRAAFPGPHRNDSKTPLQRTLPPPGGAPAPRPPAPPSQPGSPLIGIGTGTGSAVTIGSGITVDGAFNSGNFNVDFHLGTPITTSRVIHPGGGIWYYPRTYYRGCRNSYYDGYYDNSNQRYAVIDGALVQPVPTAPAPAAEPAQPAGEPPPPPTDAEIAAALMRSGDAKGAIDKYRIHLRDHADDAEAMRGLAVALIDAAEFEQGVAMMAMAYRTEPTLPDEALAARQLFTKAGDLRTTLQKAVAFANKTKTASAWLTVAVLMQAEGREEPALRMIDRADEIGLDQELVKRFKAALSV